LVTPARLSTKETPKRASCLDLVTGEAAGTEKDVDVGRLQHLIISGLLISVYLLQLGKLMLSVSAEMIATAYVSNRMPFTDLPMSARPSSACCCSVMAAISSSRSARAMMPLARPRRQRR
jgi:hypothetical protein